jgi:hypothetical protein
LDALTSLESLLVAVLSPAALLLALWSARKGLTRSVTATKPGEFKTGEFTWSMVAVGVLAGVSAAVHFGIGHGF